MEAPSSSSKVTVEYHDPHGVYQLLSPGLLSRLPLRNLHWESHAGPLRSINSLHVDLVAGSTGNSPVTDTPTASSNDLSRVKSHDSTTSGEDGTRTPNIGSTIDEREGSSLGPAKRTKSRRHQIPGLRQTPYLKIFLLRCDDNDTYKSQARKQVREWVKEHAPPSISSSKVSAQENHDAFEYLIIHVIVPNTAAATQPRTSGKSSDAVSGVTAEKTRWRGGGSTTILEKLRADFNGTSKSTVDRIAQIRIGVNDVPYDILPRVVPAIPGSFTESQQENDNAWADLVSKFKVLILSSFDMRVSQYEEDIREKDAQRTLPGWNFCTFFMLKEGLARGFENVGLVEDALVGYDELSVGLETIVREQRLRLRVGAGAQHGAFLTFTDDLQALAEKARSAILAENGVSGNSEDEETIDLQAPKEISNQDVDEIALNASKKGYRDLILANNISVFDFRCYIFARQLSLLLRLANATSSQEELLAKLKEQRESSLLGVAARQPTSQTSDETENLATLGEICRRAMEFVSVTGRIMRDDIWTYWMQSQEGSAMTKEQLRTDATTSQVVDNLVASFTFAVTQQILAQTSTKALPIPPSSLAPPSSTLLNDGQEQKTSIPEPKTMMHPARTSSLITRSVSGPLSPGIFPGGPRTSFQDQQHSTFLKAGLEELAARRAELYMLSRSIVEQAGKQRGWSVGWAEVAHLQGDNVEVFDDIDLDGEAGDHEDQLEEIVEVAESQPICITSYGIDNRLLSTALQEKEDFYRLYETLTDKALRHYTVANRLQSVHANMTELAVLRYFREDHAAAASYFHQLTPEFGDDGWAQVELSMLIMYAKCLKELGRKEEYVRVALKLLSKSARVEKEKLLQKSGFKFGRQQKSFTEEAVQADMYLSSLLEITASTKNEWVVPLENFFGHVEIDPTLRYQEEQDSISLRVHFQYLLTEVLQVQKAKVRLSQQDVAGGRDIWFESTDLTEVRKGCATLTLHSNVIAPGIYVATYVALYTSNVTFQHEHQPNTAPTKGARFFLAPSLSIFQRADVFDAQLHASRYMHLDKTRYLEIELSSGHNLVESGDLQVRAATAGLRLQTSEAIMANGSFDITTKKSEPGIVRFGRMAAGSHGKIRMPFSLEHEVNEVAVRVEISYKTQAGTFILAKLLNISIMLPLGVNVQDVFKHRALFSKFTISSATTTPLRLLSTRLAGSDVFEASGGTMTLPLVVFPRQPASMLYKIVRKPQAGRNSSSAKLKSSLSLILNYVTLEEEVEMAIAQELLHAFKDTPLQAYSRLVLPTVTAQLRAHLNSYELERIAVLNEIQTSLLASVDWRKQFSGLGQQDLKDIASLLAEALESWQKSKAVVKLIPIVVDEDTIGKSRSIIIPVDVPSVNIVHTADLKLLETLALDSSTPMTALNQPIPATLELKWTKRWDSESKIAKPPAQDLEFYYEVSAAADTWLIGGKRKGHFNIPADQALQNSANVLTFPIVLIPLREGYLQFPDVEIKSVSRALGGQGVDSITSEVDYKNIGESVRCISDARKTTVSLDASGPQGGAWLLETERRTGSSGVDVAVR